MRDLPLGETILSFLYRRAWTIWRPRLFFSPASSGSAVFVLRGWQPEGTSGCLVLVPPLLLPSRYYSRGTARSTFPLGVSPIGSWPPHSERHGSEVNTRSRLSNLIER